MGAIISTESSKIYKPKLLNAVSMNSKYPNSFKIPSKDKIIKLRIGDFVKIVNNTSTPERFWVIITKKKGNNFIGIINNKLIGRAQYNLGDLISFKSYNICDIQKK